MILYALNLADLATTLYALGHGAVELNPIVAALPPAAFAAAKIALYPLCRWLAGRESYPYLVGALAATAWWNLMYIWY